MLPEATANKGNSVWRAYLNPYQMAKMLAKKIIANRTVRIYSFFRIRDNFSSLTFSPSLHSAASMPKQIIILFKNVAFKKLGKVVWR
jgi:hypothetical protein